MPRCTRSFAIVAALLLPALGRPRTALAEVPSPTVMRAEGVEDPFPDKPPKSRLRDAGALMGIGFGLGAAAMITARLTLLPDCSDERDVSTCAVPSSGDIGIRGGRLAGTIAFSTGGAVFGALGARELGEWLQARPGPRPRRVAIGLGATAVSLGVIGIVAGATVLGVGAHRGLALGRSLDGTTVLGDAELATLERTVDQVRIARAGLMVLAVAPTLFATGVSLLVHRPQRSRVSVAPIASRRMMGVTATVRF